MSILEETLSVFIVEDDQEACKNLITYSEDTEDISVVGVTNNADKAVSEICSLLPDAIILDLELNQGRGNGLSVLQQNMQGN